jgi:hypothetical protein
VADINNSVHALCCELASSDDPPKHWDELRESCRDVFVLRDEDGDLCGASPRAYPVGCDEILEHLHDDPGASHTERMVPWRELSETRELVDMWRSFMERLITCADNGYDTQTLHDIVADARKAVGK